MENERKTLLEDVTQSDLFHNISDICAAVNAVTCNDELLAVSLQKTLFLFQAARGSIFILDDNGKDLILKISQGMKNQETTNMVKRLGEGIVGRVAETKQPVFVDDISTDTRFGSLKPRGSYQTPSFICAPLLIKDQLIGVINISDKESGLRFTKNEMQLLDFLSSQIALNYRRIQLYEKFKKILKETQTLKDKLGETNQEATQLKKQVHIQEKLATIGKLAGGIAHEFNNPLDGVMRYTNLCLEHTKEDEVVRGYLLEIKHGLHRMANIVKNLLACSRSDFPHSMKVNLHAALEHALSSKSSDITSKNIRVAIDVQPDIPDINDLGLELVITNLIRNAIESMSDSGELNIKAYVEGERLHMVVQDTGCGIPDEKINEIFEPFFTTKDIDKGCGLGLTIVGEVIKSYAGTIDVESEINKGTKFEVAIPINA
ncbi:MAG: GAF domain-containing sensor histidine kinase [Candidatus Omnitrophica bacterium]|nr:GAF domain-containing sensor histidine kinase [Candidatus Omnitrophota bacterium]